MCMESTPSHPSLLHCRKKKGKTRRKGKGCKQKGREKRRKTNRLVRDRDQLQAQLDGVAGVVTQLQTTLDHANMLYNCVKPHFATPVDIIHGAERFIGVLQGLRPWIKCMSALCKMCTLTHMSCMWSPHNTHVRCVVCMQHAYFMCGQGTPCILHVLPTHTANVT